MKPSHFYAMLSRMKYINRWGLMNNTRCENISEHSHQTAILAHCLVLLHNIFNTVAFPFSGALGNGLRAAGDVKYTMYCSIFTTVGVRLVFSWVFALGLNLGVMGIAWAMCADWTARGTLYFIRLKRGKWKTQSVI